MQYVNPYELLNLSSTYLSDIDSVQIRRARTALFRQIDLSISEDNRIGYVEYREIQLTRADCIKIIDELDDKNKKEFHFFIYQNKPLNDFLSNGSISFFDNYKVESIYKLPAFIDFISPYFSQQYNKKLSEFFVKWDVVDTTKILSITPLVNSEHIEKSYSNVRIFLRGIINEIKYLREKIEEKNSFTNSDLSYKIYSLITKSINTELINLLPEAQFQSIRNTLGDTIQYLAVIVNNIEYNKSDSDKTKNLLSCFEVIEVAKKIVCKGLEEKRIWDNYYILKRNLESYQNRIEFQKKKPTLNKYTQVIESIVAKTSEVDNKTTTPNLVKTWLSGAINTTEINLLDATFIETKNEIALSLKSLSVSIWNRHDDIDIALFTLSKAMAIDSDVATKSKLQNAKVQLEKLKIEIEKRREAQKQILSKYKHEKSGYGVLIGVIAFIVIIYLVSSSNNSSSSKSSYTNNIYPTPVMSTDTTSETRNSSPPPNTNYSSNNTNSSEPVYTKVAINSGNFPSCSGFKPKYDKTISTKLIISAESTDIALKIFDDNTDRCIRFVFVNSGTSYTVKNIPEGNYYLKIAYGNDWSVQEGEPACKGHFTSNVTYKKDNSLYNFNKIYNVDGSVSIPYYTLRLYRTYTTVNAQDNLEGNSISESDFNN